MSKDPFTFYHYISTYDTNNVQKFKSLFGDKIHDLPHKLNSRQLHKYLNVRDGGMLKQHVFTSVYMEFFKCKLMDLS